MSFDVILQTTIHEVVDRYVTYISPIAYNLVQITFTIIHRIIYTAFKGQLIS